MFSVEPVDTRYAGWLRRSAAYLIDVLLLFVGVLASQAVLYLANPLVRLMSSQQTPAAWQIHLWVFATVSVPFWLYYALTQSSSRQATPGMRLFKLQVTDIHGQRLTFGRALLRAIIMLLPFELNHAVMFYLMSWNSAPSASYWAGMVAVYAVIAMYIATIFVTRRRQGIHDLVAGTLVVKNKPSPIFDVTLSTWKLN